MTTAKPIIAGFDIRRPIAEQSSRWPEERRVRFLLRPETPWPISVDPSVWPVFISNPDETYPLQLWGSVSEILATLPQEGGPRNSSPTIIEIAVMAAEEQSLRHWETVLFKRVRPEKDSKFGMALDCLGHDVADRYLVSGLNNCMLSPKELSEVRKDWSSAINSCGLFGDPEDAKIFCAVCNGLVPEHAPFETYRVRKVEISPTIEFALASSPQGTR